MVADPLTIFQGAIIGLKSAADLAKSLGELKTTAEVQAKAVELQQIILGAQSNALEAQGIQFSLLEQIRELEKKLADIKAWETEKQKYELKELRPNSFAYILKENPENNEPTHHICALCYEDQRKSILQIGKNGPSEVLRCHNCSSEITVKGWPTEAQPKRANFGYSDRKRPR